MLGVLLFPLRARAATRGGRVFFSCTLSKQRGCLLFAHKISSLFIISHLENWTQYKRDYTVSTPSHVFYSLHHLVSTSNMWPVLPFSLGYCVLDIQACFFVFILLYFSFVTDIESPGTENAVPCYWLIILWLSVLYWSCHQAAILLILSPLINDNVEWIKVIYQIMLCLIL